MGFCVCKRGPETGTDGKPESLCVWPASICDRLLDGATPDGVGVAAGGPSSGALLVRVATPVGHLPFGDGGGETRQLPQSAPTGAADPPHRHARRLSLL